MTNAKRKAITITAGALLTTGIAVAGVAPAQAAEIAPATPSSTAASAAGNMPALINGPLANVSLLNNLNVEDIFSGLSNVLQFGQFQNFG